MKKKTYYVREEQLEKLELLSQALPGSPDEAKLVREGIDLITAKYLRSDWVKKALRERAKKEERVLRDALGNGPADLGSDASPRAPQNDLSK